MHALLRLHPEELHRILMTRGKRLQLGALRTIAGDEQPRIWKTALHPRQRADNPSDSFPRGQPRCGEQQWIRGRQPAKRPGSSLFR